MQMQALSFFNKPAPAKWSLSPPSAALISGRRLISAVIFRPRTFRCSASFSPSTVVDEKKFLEASENGNVIPVYKCIFSDHLSPILSYRCLVKEDDRDTPSFLFESVEPGHRASSVGRFSVVGSHPKVEIVAKENKVTILDHESGTVTEKFVEDPMTVPRSLSEGWRPQLVEELPDAFCGGWVGNFTYDTVRYVEPKKLPFSKAPKDDRNLPDIHLGLYDDVFVFDHVDKRLHVIHWIRLDQYASAKDAYDDGMKRLDMLVAKVHNIEPPRLTGAQVDFSTSDFGQPLESNMTKEEYMNNVLEAKEHILAGDIFQIVLSQRFEKKTFADPFEVYRALRIVNPSPYMSYLQEVKHLVDTDVAQSDFSTWQILIDEPDVSGPKCQKKLKVIGLKKLLPLYLISCELVKTSLLSLASSQSRGCILVASSPEILIRVNKKKITYRPLAGTNKRGKTLLEDDKLETDLLKDEKQRAEHIMLVDLGRNDVGKVAKPGSVSVEKLMNIERYSHVMHISSTVTGELLDNLTGWDALRAALPVGTVSGAPKVKAMELIDQFEPTRRGPYSGGFGGISFSVDLDIALALRTIVFPTGVRYDTMYMYGDGDGDKRHEWIAHVQAGSGIVADSRPEDEQIECEHKAAGLARAIELAEAAFVKQDRKLTKADEPAPVE